MTGYMSPSNEMLMKPPLLGKYDKEKLTMGAIEAGARHMAWVPAPVKYDMTKNWQKNFHSPNYGKFFTAKRYGRADEIELEAKKKVNVLGGKNPGPANYLVEKQWIKKSNHLEGESHKIMQDKRTSFNE